MPATPGFSHHEVFGLLAPFTARGWRLDATRCDRAARSLWFRPEQFGAHDDERLHLASPHRGRYRLIRCIPAPAGPAASLGIEGHELAPMIDRLMAPAAERQFLQGAGYRVALHRHWLAGAAAHQPPQLTGAELPLGALTLTVNFPKVHGLPVTGELRPVARHAPLPEDLLAVLGRHWSTLEAWGSGWRFRLRLRIRPGHSDREAEDLLHRTAAHLARTLAEPPSRYHERLWVARWAATARRSMFLLAWVGAALGFPVAATLGEADMVWRALVAGTPALLLAMSFVVDDRPRLVWPRVPRALTMPAWPGA